MTTELYAHFHPGERPFVEQATDWLQRVERDHTVRRTDFLDPRQQYILQTLANRYSNLTLKFFGGYEHAERKRAFIAQDYHVIDDEDPGIQVLEITADGSKLADLDHGDFMGSILGLGLKRDKIGDIHVWEQGCHCIAASETIDFLNVHLRQVHRIHVLTSILTLDQLRYTEPKLEEKIYTVASLRLDAVLSDAIRVGRNKIIAPIKAGHCRVNWKVEMNPAATLQENDLISLKGYGRFKLLEIGGKSKKERIHITIGKYV